MKIVSMPVFMKFSKNKYDNIIEKTKTDALNKENYNQPGLMANHVPFPK